MEVFGESSAPGNAGFAVISEYLDGAYTRRRFAAPEYFSAQSLVRDTVLNRWLIVGATHLYTFDGASIQTLTQQPLSFWGTTSTSSWAFHPGENAIYGVKSVNAQLQCWKFAAGAWAQIPVNEPMSSLTSTTLTYDPQVQDILAVGGYGPALSSAIWQRDVGLWVATPRSLPVGVAAASVFYNTQQGSTLVLGGTGPQGNITGGYVWTAASGWQSVPAQPSPMGHPTRFAYVPTTGAIHAFFGGGFANLSPVGDWTLVPTNGPQGIIEQFETGLVDGQNAVFALSAGQSARVIYRTNGAWIGMPANYDINHVPSTLAWLNTGGAPALHVAGMGILERWTGSQWQPIGNGWAPNGRVGGVFAESVQGVPAYVLLGSFSTIERTLATGDTEQLPAPGAALFMEGQWLPMRGAGPQFSTGGEPLVVSRLSGGAASRFLMGGPIDGVEDHPARRLASFALACEPVLFDGPPAVVQPDQPNADAVLTCNVRGTGPLSYQWRFGGVPMTENPPRVEGSNARELFVRAWTMDDAGEYDCVVTNALGSATSPSVTVTLPNIPPNGLIEFEVVARSNAPDAPTGWTALRVAGLDGLGRVKVVGNHETNGLSVFSYDNGVGTELMTPQTVLPDNTSHANFDPDTETSSSIHAVVALPQSAAGIPLWVLGDSGFRALAVPGQPAPEWNGERNVSNARADAQRPTEADRVFFRRRSQNSAGLDSRAALILSTPEGETVLARDGDPAPGVAGGVYDSLWNSAVERNDCGEVLLKSDFKVVDPAPTIGTAVWVGPPLNPELRLSTGQQIEVTPGTERTIFQVFQARLMNDGSVLAHVCFQSQSLFCDQAWLVQSSTGAPTVLWREGTLFEDYSDAWRLINVSEVKAHPSGSVLFYAEVQPQSCAPNCVSTVRGVWRRTPQGVVHRVWLESEPPPPGLLPGTRLSGVTLQALSDSDVAFLTAGTDFGTVLLGWKEELGLLPILAPGSQVQIADGQYVTVNSLLISRLHSNEVGEFAVGAQFTNSQFALLLGRFSEFLRAWSDCPVVYLEPHDAAVYPGTTHTATCLAAGGETREYQWFLAETPLTDGPLPGGATYAGTNTPSLTISESSDGHVGQYACRVRNACGEAWSRPAQIVVGIVCDSIDFNNDGVLPSSDDVFDFLTVFAGGPCPTLPPVGIGCNDIDFNNDGVSPSTDDIEFFLRVLAGGDCS